MNSQIKIPHFCVSHNTGKIAVASIVFGPYNYMESRGEILLNNLKIPTGEQTVSLLSHIYHNNKEDPKFNGIKEIVKESWFWIFNINLWTDEGVYVIKDSNATETNRVININALEEKLKGGKNINGIRFSKDRIVRFAPKRSYRFGDHTFDAIAKDGFIIASLGVKKAKELGKISTNFNNDPCISGIYTREIKTPIQTVSAIGEWDNGLGFYGGIELNKEGYAFGLLKKAA